MVKDFATKVLSLIFVALSIAGAQSAPPRKDIPAIAKAADGAIVTIITADNDKPIAQGSGFLVGPDGVVVTNYHVIANGNVAIVKFPDGTVLPVDGVLAADKTRDLAVIKMHGKKFRTLALGDSDRIQIGEAVVAIGNPLGLELTVSNGILSGVRTVEKEGGKFLQVTAPISHGSSGGPLFNMAGEVVGITSMYFEGGENLNFAIPVNDAKRLLLNQSVKLQNLPNETPAPDRADTETHAGTLAQQRACREEAELIFVKVEVFRETTTHTSHFDPVSGICYMERQRPRIPPIPGAQSWVYVHDIYNAFEGRLVGGFSQDYLRSETGWREGGPSCFIYPPGQPEITCKSEEEFNRLALKYFGITP